MAPRYARAMVFAEQAHELSPEEVKRRLDRARHVELERLASQAATIGRERPVVFQCRLGSRSGLATQAFRASGWEAYNLAGGISAWAEAGLPLEPQGGYVADH